MVDFLFSGDDDLIVTVCGCYSVPHNRVISAEGYLTANWHRERARSQGVPPEEGEGKLEKAGILGGGLRRCLNGFEREPVTSGCCDNEIRKQRDGERRCPL